MIVNSENEGISKPGVLVVEKIRRSSLIAAVVAFFTQCLSICITYE